MSISRINSVITGARMKRMVKTKAFQTKQNKSGLLRAAQTSGRSGVVSKTGSSLMDILRAMNGDTSMTGEKIVQNQSQRYEYETMRLASERVASHLSALRAEGEKSLFGQGVENREAVEKEISGFVSDYNIMIRRLAASGEKEDAELAKKLGDEITTRTATLKKFGITQDGKGVLSLDLKTLQQADYEELKNTFGSSGSLTKKLASLTESVEKNAKEQIERLEKESYSLSSVYSRYGTSDGFYGTTGSRYSQKG